MSPGPGSAAEPSQGVVKVHYHLNVQRAYGPASYDCTFWPIAKHCCRSSRETASSGAPTPTRVAAPPLLPQSGQPHPTLWALNQGTKPHYVL